MWDPFSTRRFMCVNVCFLCFRFLTRYRSADTFFFFFWVGFSAALLLCVKCSVMWSCLLVSLLVRRSEGRAPQQELLPASRLRRSLRNLRQPARSLQPLLSAARRVSDHPINVWSQQQRRLPCPSLLWETGRISVGLPGGGGGVLEQLQTPS